MDTIYRAQGEEWMQLKDHYSGAQGYTPLVAPATHPVQDLDFGMIRLANGQTYAAESGGYEVGLVVLSGTCEMAIGGEHFTALGSRATVFDGRATGAYVPRATAYSIRATRDDTEIACCRCRTEEDFPVQVVRPDRVIANERGGPGFQRYVHDIFGDQVRASRMIVGETFTVAGNWSSYPPHKHDENAPPDEVQQEELYLYKIRPANGFGLQYWYTNSGSERGALDQATAVHENDITL